MTDKKTEVGIGRVMEGASASRMALDFEQALTILRDTFGHDKLRRHQAEVLTEILDGRDCMAVLPTGAGKSLCYALPTMMRPGLTIVISPLIALIRDQVQRYQRLGIACASLDSLQDAAEKKLVWERMLNGSLKLLFVSPERLSRIDFRGMLSALNVQMVAVDEAHCISHWGGHFRPEYRKIGEYLRELGDVQRLALTATATAKVRRDIVQSLGMREPAQVWAGFLRPNLKVKVLQAQKVADQLNLTLQSVLQSEGSGIVYVPTRKNAIDVHRMLTDAGIDASPYHAGQPGPVRMQVQENFLRGKTRVVVATAAFGMGIHKDDIRFVHHCGLPSSLEQYIQESGRAGRDGKPAKCSLIYSTRDYHIRKYMLERSLPEASVLKDVYELASDLLEGTRGKSRHTLTRAIAETIPLNDRDLDSAIEILCREGILTRLTSRDGWREEMIVEGELPREEVGLFFDDVPRLRSEHMAKLDALRAFVSLPDGREQFLTDYFRPEL